MSKNIFWFEEGGKENISLLGGKGANLGEMTRFNFPIPYGFTISSYAYFSFIEKEKLEEKIKFYLKDISVEDSNALSYASTQIQKCILDAKIPDDIVNDIVVCYGNLSIKESEYLKKEASLLNKTGQVIKSFYKNVLVAVRSSATAEDLPEASFAGQQETYLNVQGEIELIMSVKKCWASLFNARAIYYRAKQGFDHVNVGIAVVVQRMIESHTSGVSFSVDPITCDKNTIVIEAIYGLGEYIVQGTVTPDHYEINKNSFVITKKQINTQTCKYVKKGKKNVEIALTQQHGSHPKLNDDEIVKIAIAVKQIEKHYQKPQDIEWAIENDQLFIVQSRPITTLNKNEILGFEINGNKLLVSGSPASPGIGTGKVKIILSPNDIDKIHEGDVLVAPQTNPDYVPAMRKACAIVTESGGRTSHAAIVSRELGIPAVVGAKGALSILKNDEIVSVIGNVGEVYEGIVNKKTNAEKENFNSVDLKTNTHVYVNLAEPERALEISKLNVDGVGLLRAEFMIANIGTHPRFYIESKKEEVFISRLYNDVKKFVDVFSPRPIVYRATDFKSNEYRNLKGGEAYETHEENPMIGYRGASRYIADTEVFAMELEMIRRLWHDGLCPVHLMIPFVRAPWELIQIKEIISKYGLFDYKDFKLWIMVEVPACALGLKNFLEIGVDGVSIGTNDLTMMLLGVDRDSEKVSDIYDERNPIVMQILKYIVRTCKKYNVTCSICGQAVSDYPELVDMLVKEGITSVSVNPDMIDKTRLSISDIEKNIAANTIV